VAWPALAFGHDRPAGDRVERNSNIFLTAYAGRRISSYSGDGAGGDEAPRGWLRFPDYPVSLRARAERVPALALRRSSATCHPDGDRRQQLDRHSRRLGGQASLVQQRAGLARIVGTVFKNELLTEPSV
jgi:hypothetical protein